MKRELCLQPSPADAVQATADQQPKPTSHACIRQYHFLQWERWWKTYKRGVEKEVRTPVQQVTLSKASLQTRHSLSKAESLLATQIHTPQIGLCAYLYKHRVPKFHDPACKCGWLRQPAKHVLISCGQWKDLKIRLFREAKSKNYWVITSTSDRLLDLKRKWRFDTRPVIEMARSSAYKKEADNIEWILK